MRAIFRSLLLAFCVILGKTIGIGIIHRLLLVSGMNARLLKKFGANIGDRVRIGWPLIIAFAKDDYSNLSIGDKCHIGKDCFLDITDRINIGNNVTVSMRTTILTHMEACDSSWARVYKSRKAAVNIEDNVYIGAGVTILCGVHIGEGSLIGASSLITRDVAPNTIVAGVPQRVLKKDERNP